jgi:hypothetical protein
MFSLKSLLFIVTLAALGAAGLVYRNEFWASGLVAITLGLLLFGGSYAWFGPKGRAFWGPFALTGTVYLAIVSFQPLQELHYNLPTTQLVTYALQKLQTPTPAPPPGYYMSSGVSYYATPTSTYVVQGSAASTSDAPAIPEPASSISPTPADPPSPVETASFESPTTTNDATVPAPSEDLQIPPPTGGAVVGALIGAPGAPVTTYSYSYTRPMLFQMATTRMHGDGFAEQARAFLWVSQCLWCLLLAFAAGMISTWCFRTTPVKVETACASPADITGAGHMS